jgi:hypothetical protein
LLQGVVTLQAESTRRNHFARRRFGSLRYPKKSRPFPTTPGPTGAKARCRSGCPARRVR